MVNVSKPNIIHINLCICLKANPKNVVHGILTGGIRDNRTLSFTF